MRVSSLPSRRRMSLRSKRFGETGSFTYLKTLSNEERGVRRDTSPLSDKGRRGPVACRYAQGVQWSYREKGAVPLLTENGYGPFSEALSLGRRRCRLIYAPSTF